MQQRGVRKGHRFFVKAVGGQLLGHQIPLGDLQFFFVGIPRQLDHFHAIEKGRGNGVERVGRGHEHHFAEIVPHFQVVVLKSVVLVGIEHFEHGGGGIAAEIGRHLVDLVEQKHGVDHFGLFHARYDTAGQCADIGATMAADLRLVAHAAQTHAHQLAPRRAGDTCHYRRFAHAGRAYETKDRPLQILGELVHRQIFHDTLFHLFQAVVVFVENLPRALQIEVVVRLFFPRHVEQPFDIRAAHARLGRRGTHFFHARRFFLYLFLHFFGQFARFGALAVFLQLVGVVAQLVVDHLDLLAQIIFALVFIDILAYFYVDLFFHRHDLAFAHHHGVNVFQLAVFVGRFQKLLLFVVLAIQMHAHQAHKRLYVVEIDGTHRLGGKTRV